MIRFVLLDLDDTILDFHRAEAEAIQKTLFELNISVNDAVIRRYSEINAAHWRRLEAGEISRYEVLTGRFRQLFKELEMECDPEKTQIIYENHLSQGHYFIPGAEELLEALQQKYRLFLVSNGNAVVQAGRLRSADISHYFENIFISEQIGADKPSKRYFERCFAQIKDFDPAQAIIVGDSLTSDIMGGVNAGIKTCWFNPKHRPNHQSVVPDYEVTSLAQLPILFQQI